MTVASTVAPPRPPDMYLLGLPIHRVGVEQVHAYIEEVITNRQKAIALNLNVFCVNLALQHAWLHEFIRGVQLVFCDGDGVRLGLKLSGYSPPPKITYNEWLWLLSAFCAQKGFSLYFLGAGPGVAQLAASRLQARYPLLKIAGFHDGFFKKAGVENQRVVDQINAAAPDILLVCFGMPLQERWLMENWQHVRAHVFLKGGAALDYAAGRLRKAPRWIVRAHLEWLYRLFQDPLRLFSRYVLGNPYFVFRVLLEKAAKILSSPAR